MFFLLRSAVCIGLVVAALPDHGAAVSGGTLAASVGVGAAAGAAQLCRSAPDRCLAVLAGGVKMPGSGAPRAGRLWLRPSRDTLSSADRRLAWSGPGTGATD